MFRLFPKSYHELNLLMLWFHKCKAQCHRAIIYWFKGMNIG